MTTTEDPLATLTRIAHEHLDAPTAERWLRMARPAVQLLVPTPRTPYDGLPVVGRLGGLPQVPDDFAWPVWEGHGPLPLVAEVDLGAVAAAGLDPGLPLPRSGRLLAFYYDGTAFEDFEGMVEAGVEESMAGVRLVHLDDDPTARRPATPPSGLHVYPERTLAGRQTVTHPRWEDAALVAEFADPGHDPDDTDSHDRWLDHPVNAEQFEEALDVLLAPGLTADDVVHQLGGWAHHVQIAVEEEVADDPLRWRPVLQIGSEPRVDDVEHTSPEEEMMWGDLGVLYWLARDDRVAELDDVRFTWQCG